MTRFIDPKTDFGFKRLFGQEDSKDILKQFLFDVLELPYPIQELSYIPTEQLPVLPGERIGVYDVYCMDAVGQRFIVEMQRGFQLFIKDRVLYYSIFPILHQGRKGTDWRTGFVPIYCIAILNFTLDDDTRYQRRIQLLDVQTKSVFYEKLTYVFIELSKFHRALDQLLSEADKWIYLLKYMPELQDIPAELNAAPFTHAFEIAREASLTEEEQWQYEMSLKRARDTLAEIESARLLGLEEGHAQGREEGLQQGLQRGLEAGLQQGLEQGLEQGLQQGLEQGLEQGLQQGLEQGQRAVRLATARSMLAHGLALPLIVEVTGLTQNELAALQAAQADQ